MTTEKLTVGYDTSEYTTTTSTHIEKILKSFDEEFPYADGRNATYTKIKAFITQALQEQDRESRRVLAEEIEKLLNKNCEGDVYTDSITEEVIALIKQDEN